MKLIIIASLLLLGLWSCSKESPKRVSEKVLHYLKESYNEPFQIKEIHYYDSFKQGTWTHKSSGWQIKAAPLRFPNLDFKVVYSEKQKAVRTRGIPDFYVQSFWRKQIEEHAERLLKPGCSIPSITFRGMSKIYGGILESIGSHSRNQVPDFDEGFCQGYPLQMAVTIHFEEFEVSDLKHFILPFLEWLRSSGAETLTLEVMIPMTTNSEEKTQSSIKLRQALGVAIHREDTLPSMEELRKLLFQDHTSWRTLSPIFRQALEHHKAGRTEQALANYNEILSLHIPYGSHIPFVLESAWNTAMIHLKNENYSACIQNLDLVLSFRYLPSSYYSRVGKKPYNRKKEFGLMQGDTHYAYYREAAEKIRQICSKRIMAAQ